MLEDSIPRIPRINHQRELGDAEGEILDRVDTLYRLSRKGCEYLRSMSDEFERTRKKLCELDGDEFAFLNDSSLIRQLIHYEEINPRVREGKESIEVLIEKRRLCLAFMIFEKTFENDPDVWE